MNKNAEMQILQKKATAEIIKKIDEISVQVAKERNASIVIDRSSVIYGAPADITSTVMSRLNSQMTSVSINRLPRKAN